MFEDDMILWLHHFNDCGIERQVYAEKAVCMGNPTPAKDMLGQE
jgi:hypothetical protein